ncbi:hypothetical protein [Nocardia wallacei]|uniref:hypothetical protein n=1 Tax=Nocardia wallacei TaxID=480035 RepID=UPI0016569B4B|nr:hypothetical protein [Nocardia wallacei]
MATSAPMAAAAIGIDAAAEAPSAAEAVVAEGFWVAVAPLVVVGVWLDVAVGRGAADAAGAGVRGVDFRPSRSRRGSATAILARASGRPPPLGSVPSRSVTIRRLAVHPP